MKLEGKERTLICLMLISSFSSPVFVSAAPTDCGPGYGYNQRFARCVQSNCNRETIEDAHLSYVGDCVCGSSESIDENPEDPNKECSRPADYASCPGCVYACVHLDEPCPDEKPKTTTTTTKTTVEAEQEYGVFERDGKLYINSPPNGPLSISMSDLPAWARARMVTVGAVIPNVGPPDAVKTGDATVILDGRPVARLGDDTEHGGKIVEGSDSIFVNGVPAAFRGGFATCPMITGSVPHVGGPIAWNCDVLLKSGLETGPEGLVECMEEWAEQKRRDAGVGGMSEEAFCASMERNVWYPAQGKSAAWALSTFCRPSVRTLKKPATRGSTVLEVEGEGINVGDTLVIGSDTHLAETAKVAGKGSVILEQPLKNSYPAGTLVTIVPANIADLAPHNADKSTGPLNIKSVGVLLLVGGVILLPLIFIALIVVLAIIVLWRLRKKKPQE